MKINLLCLSVLLSFISVRGQKVVDSIYINGDLFLKKDLSAELNIVSNHIDHSEQGHSHELWGYYLDRAHPSVATVNKYMQQAAAEFNVPVALLKAIGQVENNWTQMGPSIDKGWGIMHLVQNNYCNTLSEAAQLLGVTEQTLKDDAEQNIRGAAALLKKYAATKKAGKLNWHNWYVAAQRFSGLISEELRIVQANRYFGVMTDGVVSTTLWSEQVFIQKNKSIDLSFIVSPQTVNASGENDGSRSADYGPAVSSFTTCNYSTGRSHSIDTWVNHWIGTGTAAGAVSWFQNCSASASAHFVTANNGTIYQVVPVANTAWHCGASGYPYNNSRSIGEEHEATVSNPGLWNSTAMLQASAQMACYFCGVYNIPTNQNHTSPGICGHQNMPGTNTDCPGTIPWATWFTYFNSGNCNAQPPVQPTNDYCGNATALTVYGNTCGTTTTGSVNGATQSATPTTCDGFASANAYDVWYTFTATANSHTITVVPSSGLDAVVDLRTACPGITIDCQDAGGGEGATETLQVTGLSIGTTYYVRVYDYSGAGNAPTTTSFTICVTTPCSQPVKPTITGTNSFCSGNSSTLSVSNPCNGCTYTWSNGGNGTSTTVTTSGSYKVTPTNNCGTVSSDPYNVTVNPAPQPVIINLSNAYCAASADVQLSATPTGGIFSGTGINGNMFSPATAGVGTHSITYTVTQGGCTGNVTQSTTVSASPLVQISANGPTAFCDGGSVTLTATQGSSYAWSNGAATQSIIVNQAGSFSVTVTNPGGCNASVASANTMAVSVFNNPVAFAGADQTLLQAPNNTVAIGSSPTAFGGTAPYNYQWSPSTGLSSNATSNPAVSNLPGNTLYSVTVTDVNGCTATDDVLVSISPLCTYTSLPSYFSFASNGGIDSFYVSVADTTCASWSVSGCNWINILSPVAPYSGNAWVKFSVTANADSLQRSCAFTLTGGQNVLIVQQGITPDPCNPPLAVPTVQANFCDLAANLIPGVSYQWYNGSGLIQGANTRFYTVAQSGYYYVVVSDSDFCSAQSADVYVAYPLCLGSGVDDISESSYLIISPNPMSGSNLQVQINSDFVSGEVAVQDVLGRTIVKQIAESEVFTLHVEHLASGTYYVYAKAVSGKTLCRKLVKY